MKNTSLTSSFYLCDWCCLSPLDEMEEGSLAAPVKDYRTEIRIFGSTIRLAI